MKSLHDTIAALATPEGTGLRALVRISGPAARTMGEQIAGVPLRDREPMLAALHLETPRPENETHEGIGPVSATLTLFAAPRSYTREDLLEITLPSSPPLLQALLATIIRRGARLAEPGEFTRRAFLHGRIDLTRAEGVLELVRSRNENEAKAGLLLLEGGLSQRVATLRSRLEGALALIEASLDFEESDTGHIDAATLLAELEAASEGLEEATQWETRRLPSRGEFRVFFWGEPNAGKSSLLNRLDPRARAIVSPIAGTTRDCLRGSLHAEGLEIALLDAAGMERGEDALGVQAQEIARRFRESADAVLGVFDATKPMPEFLRQGRVDLLVRNKIDLLPSNAGSAHANAIPGLSVSALTGQGIESLREAILGLARGAAQAEGERMALAQRHRDAFVRAAESVALAKRMLRQRDALDAVAGQLRESLNALGEIDGRSTPEDILDRIFSQFCIGK